MKKLLLIGCLFGYACCRGQSLSAVIASDKGNVVYVDFWASWCGHCLDEMGDYEERLQRNFTYQPVKFVFVSMDATQDTAKAMEIIRSRHIKGTQLFWSWDGIMKAPEYLPTYMLFNQNGKLVIADAKRPSDTIKLYRQIDSLLHPNLYQ